MDIRTIDNRNEFSGLLFSDPTHFRVEYKINPYMEPTVDVKQARSNWVETIRKTRQYTFVQTVDYETFITSNVPISHLPDVVFVANHALPLPNGKYILANLKPDERKDEPQYFDQWATHNGYNVVDLKPGIDFEGQGDSKWHPKKNLLWVGYGQRTDKKAVEEIKQHTNATVIGLELTSPLYYHLDVCFTALDKDSVIIIPEAFTNEAYEKINSVFQTVYHVPQVDYDTMGGNSSRIAEDTIMIDYKNEQTIQLLEDYGYDVVSVDTTEFQKSGGSVDCLSIRLP